MSIASFEQLKDITQDLWRKAKAKIEAIANDYVSKTLPNNVIGETVFSDGHIEGATLNYFNKKPYPLLVIRFSVTPPKEVILYYTLFLFTNSEKCLIL